MASFGLLTTLPLVRKTGFVSLRGAAPLTLSPERAKSVLPEGSRERRGEGRGPGRPARSLSQCHLSDKSVQPLLGGLRGEGKQKSRWFFSVTSRGQKSSGIDQARILGKKSEKFPLKIIISGISFQNSLCSSMEKWVAG